MSKKPFTYKQFKSIYSQVPRLSVDLVINYLGGVVLIERALESYKGQWHLPGGTVFYKESIAAAAKRIAKNETGLDVAIGNLLGYIEYHSEEKERGFGYTVGLAFSCNIVGGNINLDDGGKCVMGFSVLPENTVIDQKVFLKKLGYKE